MSETGHEAYHEVAGVASQSGQRDVPRNTGPENTSSENHTAGKIIRIVTEDDHGRHLIPPRGDRGVGVKGPIG